MAQMTADKFAQRCFDCDLLDAHQVEAVWSEFGSRDVELEDFTAILLRKELLTNFQVDRLLDGKRDGYFYGKNKVLYMVGAGTFARVYRAHDMQSGKVVAVKVLRQRYVEDLVTRDQFLREARMVMPLRHINVVPIYEVAEERGRPFMVMEFVEGQNLRDFIRVRKRMDALACIKLLIDVCAGLDYGVGHGVTHRDLKLSNVLVTSLGRAKLVDFGLAAVSADMTDEAIAGAPNPRSIDYAGLERVTGVRKGDSRSDLYFAGCMLYHMLSGKSPLFETRDRIQRLSIGRFRDVKPLNKLVDDLPSYVVSIVNRSMDLKPERRYQTPAEMLRELKKAKQRFESGDLGTSTETPAGPSEEPAEGAPVEQEGQDRRVMIVESNSKLQDQFRERLKRRGYRVLIVSNPQLALQRFEDHLATEPLVDCVVFNSQFLGEGALTAFNALLDDEYTRDIPAILLLDPSQKEMIRAAKLADHRLLLALPVSVKRLRAALIKLRRLQQETGS